MPDVPSAPTIITSADCEIIEVIAPSGFESYFREVAKAWGDMAAFAAINQKYALDMRFESVPSLCERFGLTFPSV